MGRYAVATAAGSGYDANEPMGMLWNPSSPGGIVLRVTLVQVIMSASLAGGTRIRLFRVSTAGTAGSTTTPDIDNHFDNRVAPPSGALMYRPNWTVAPTQVTPELTNAHISQGAGAEVAWQFPHPIHIHPNNGLAVYGVTAGTGTAVSFEWEE